MMPHMEKVYEEYRNDMYEKLSADFRYECPQCGARYHNPANLTVPWRCVKMGCADVRIIERKGKEDEESNC